MTVRHSHLSLEITHHVTSSLAVRLNCAFSYRTDDPLAVTLVFGDDTEWPVRWVLCRELLAAGLVSRQGEGEVVLWPAPDDDGPSSFCLRVGGDRTALFEIPVGPVAEWLAGTYAMVPPGTELSGVDWTGLLELAE
jgi:hypothetical protein